MSYEVVIEADLCSIRASREPDTVNLGTTSSQLVSKCALGVRDLLVLYEIRVKHDVGLPPAPLDLVKIRDDGPCRLSCLASSTRPRARCRRGLLAQP